MIFGVDSYPVPEGRDRAREDGGRAQVLEGLLLSCRAWITLPDETVRAGMLG